MKTNITRRTQGRKLLAQNHTGVMLDFVINNVHEKNRVYWCGYWRQLYIVLEVNDKWVTCRWLEDGRITNHCTLLDPSCDFIVKEHQEKILCHLYNKHYF